jgi:hypothetical protein
LSDIQRIGEFEEAHDFGIDLIWRSEFDAVSDAIFFAAAAGIDHAFGEFAFVGGEAEAEIDARIGRGLDLAIIFSRWILRKRLVGVCKGADLANCFVSYYAQY